MSAAWNQRSSPLTAFNITSRIVIARSQAASGYAIEPPQLCRYPVTPPSTKRTDHLLSGAVRSCTPYTSVPRLLDILTAAAIIGAGIAPERIYSRRKAMKKGILGVLF